jgi:hypothetical protein
MEGAMKIETKFDIGQRVFIVEIESPAIVRAIRIDERAFCYLVSYWMEGKQQDAWVSECELAEAPS